MLTLEDIDVQLRDGLIAIDLLPLAFLRFIGNNWLCSRTVLK